jgi:hypothetical protein
MDGSAVETASAATADKSEQPSTTSVDVRQPQSQSKSLNPAHPPPPNYVPYDPWVIAPHGAPAAGLVAVTQLASLLPSSLVHPTFVPPVDETEVQRGHTMKAASPSAVDVDAASVANNEAANAVGVVTSTSEDGAPAAKKQRAVVSLEVHSAVDIAAETSPPAADSPESPSTSPLASPELMEQAAAGFTTVSLLAGAQLAPGLPILPAVGRPIRVQLAEAR